VTIQRFQSHLGSISTWRTSHTAPLQARFNPTLVRLAPRRADVIGERAAGFNPTLVRLAQVPYQSWYGGAQLFQSHLGSISTASRSGAAPGQHRFNPTLVRLARQRGIVMITSPRFQSHLGSISTERG